MSSVNNLTKEPTSTPQQAYRSPPPIPNSHPPNDSTNNSPTSVLASMPPQAPARTNIKTSSVSSRNQLTDVDSGSGSSRSQVLSGRGELGVASSSLGNSTTSPLNSGSVSSSGIGTNQNNAKDTSPVNQNHENATDAVKRLVYKTVMMGSIPSLNMNNNGGNNQSGVSNVAQNESEPLETTNYKNTPKSFGEPTTTMNKQFQEVSGVLSNSGDNQTVSNPSLSSESKPRKTSPNMTKNLARTNSTVQSRQNNLPWIPINGETIINKDENEPIFSEIIFVMPDNRGIRGKMFISNFRLYFRSDETYSFTNYHSNLIIDLPLGLINRIEKIGHQSSKHTNFYGILISCKNGRRLRFANTQLKGSRKQIYELLQKYAFPISNNMNFFAFSYNQSFSDNSGWQGYDVRQEYERMGILKSNDWRFSTINIDFKFCDTYPKLLIVPQIVKDEELRQVAEFRSKHRIPVVSWLKYDNRKNSVALLRSSQPLVGLTQKRSEKDENYLYTIYKINTINSLDKLYIMDARPVQNAMANRATGGGYESEDNYKECEMCFLNIHNIHVMRESLRKVYEMAMPVSRAGAHPGHAGAQQHVHQTANANGTLLGTNAHHGRSTSFGGTGGGFGASGGALGTGGGSSSQQTNGLNDDRNFFVNLENSKWLEYIKAILNGALRIVKYIHGHNSSVLVHCSDGWDRTAQLTSLSMLMMDKYYRTLKGFQVLIDKEWLSFGHRFGTRMGHGSDKYSDQDRSPIFLQFIDCVWQILQQNSKVFEFNEKLLLTIVNNMYTCQFGTFLYNNECERERNDVRNKTVSLWSYINSYKVEFRNNAYIEYDGVVECSTSLSSLQLWTAYYFQYREIIDDSVSDVTVNSISKASTSGSNSTNPNSQNLYTFTPPMASSRMFGQAFFQQVVNQMKATVRNQASQEPELVRYKASVQQADIS